MKYARLIPILLLPCLLLGQTSLTRSSNKTAEFGYATTGRGVSEVGMASVTGREINVTGSLIKCSGNCGLRIHDVVLNADEVDIRPETGDAEARGNVKIKVLPPAAGYQF
jgi:lipopolysaccharide assembly outer membrane protein LptD (OstA)